MRYGRLAENMIWNGYTTQQKKGLCVCVKRIWSKHLREVITKLVGGFTPSEKYWSIGMIKMPNIRKNIIHVPNHQPENVDGTMMRKNMGCKSGSWQVAA